MPILVVGSVAFDTIKSPYGKVERRLGGAATYFSLSASYFAEVRVIAVVGDDFTLAEEAVFKKRSIDIRGIERVKGKCFFWDGEYGENLNEAKTNNTELNVFEHFRPKIPREYQGSDYLFLANIDPVLQADVRSQMDGLKLVGGDTMNFWINGKPKELDEVIAKLDVLLINDGEARMLGKDPSIPRAAVKILVKGPQALVIKHGEYGATIFFRDGFAGGTHPFRAPALPMNEVVDPTGAGDAFAGGFMGYIAAQGKLDRDVLKKAMFYGGVMGSFAVERFATERLQNLSREEIDKRYQLFRDLSHID